MPFFDSNIDLGGSQLLNAIMQNLAAAPAPTKGRMFFNTATNKFGCGNGTSFDYIGGLSVSSLDDVPDSATRLAFLPVERTKLTGIAAGATVNSSDAALLNRANHTGTQLASTISDFSTAADARIQLIVGAAPAALDTLTELATALGNDPNYAATITNQIGAMNTAIGLRALDSAVCHWYHTIIGNAAATSIVVTHNLNTLYVTTSVCQVSDNSFVECDVVATTANTITLSFTNAPAANSLRVAVQG